MRINAFRFIGIRLDRLVHKVEITVFKYSIARPVQLYAYLISKERLTSFIYLVQYICKTLFRYLRQGLPDRFAKDFAVNSHRLHIIRIGQLKYMLRAFEYCNDCRCDHKQFME